MHDGWFGLLPEPKRASLGMSLGLRLGVENTRVAPEVANELVWQKGACNVLGPGFSLAVYGWRTVCASSVCVSSEVLVGRKEV